jgi:hypothetical protein
MPPPITGAEAAFAPYLVGGGPVSGARARLATSAPAATQRSDSPAAATATATAERQARRRRQREALKDPGDRYEYLDSNDTDVAPVASASGAGQMGFPGTVRHETDSGVTGLTTLTDSAAGAGPTVPMLPHTWEGPEDPQTLH